jgi:methyl-accepting chemotaxis protein
MLAALVPSIARTAELVQDISAACNEQSTGAAQVNKALQELDGVIQQNASSSEETAATSSTISQQARQLRESISFFQVRKATKRMTVVRSKQPKPLEAAEDDMERF